MGPPGSVCHPQQTLRDLDGCDFRSRVDCWVSTTEHVSFCDFENSGANKKLITTMNVQNPDVTYMLYILIGSWRDPKNFDIFFDKQKFQLDDPRRSFNSFIYN